MFSVRISILLLTKNRVLVCRSVLSDSLRPHGLWLTSLLCPWDSVGCHFLLQGIFLTQRSNLGLLYWKQTLYSLSHQGNFC